MKNRSYAAMRGISPVIATVIILAVTVAIAVAVIGWITGLFGAATGGTEQLQLMPDSYINVSDIDPITFNRVAGLHLHVANKGTDVTISSIEVVETREKLPGPYYVLDSDAPSVRKAYEETHGTTTRVIRAGSDVWILATLSKSYVAGAQYTVKIYTKGGNVFVGRLVARK